MCIVSSLGIPLLSLEFSEKEASDHERERERVLKQKQKTREGIGAYKKGRHKPC